ncbi:MAG TPA: DUF6268 family outer membrane beta-barrel protein [Kofleriaceae bacterium]
MRRAIVLAVVSTLASVASADPVHPKAAEPLRTAAADPGAVDPIEAATEPVVHESAGQRLSPRADMVLASIGNTHNGSLDVTDYRIKAAAPLARGDSYGLALLASYSQTQLDFPVGFGREQLQLHKFEAMVGGGMGLPNDWSLRGSAGASHASDLHDTSWDAVQFTTCAMLHHVMGPSDAIVFGLVYTSTSPTIPVIPLLGYVHQREGSRFKLDVFLPHHVRAEWQLTSWLHGAIAGEASGDTWAVAMAKTQMKASREGGAGFAELQWLITHMVHLEARAGVSVDRYALPMQIDGQLHDQPLRASTFGQLSLVVAP